MTTYMMIFESFSRLLLLLALAWFVMTNLQYFSYRYDRLLFHHTKPLWTIFYLIVPILLYYVGGQFYWIFLYIVYLPVLYMWHRKLDKKLVLTARIKRFFAILIAIECLSEASYYYYRFDGDKGVVFILLAALIISHAIETVFRYRFRVLAHQKLLKRENLTVIALTASYGKTSAKHFLTQILSQRFKTYATPGNVNTDLGICADINNHLPDDAEIYIVEAGARQKGDILSIALLTEPHYSIIGKVGAQHIEYFKTIENIQSTKRELLVSPRMKLGVVHESAGVKPNNEVLIVRDEQIQNTKATLDGTEWDLALEEKTIHFKTPVLGSFNALNISLAFLLARTLGIADDAIVQTVASLKNFDHRLQPIRTTHKLILDDSYNGNLEGMLSAIELAATYEGRKVIVTPGIVESDEASNITLAARINEVFDLVLITGAMNADILSSKIDRAKRKRIFDKRDMQTMLGANTRTGDLILFANDAPTFV
ncbi:UDP-N-acetylmuramoyl-tripeptide--D-alanyl-D-alanine ligase [Campylobacterota bacterium]|nr:UDP-N-acetylmuramoyl-tripeptide--D-alanyl-D-alanine ligase [Campylobacterota bacterium]